MSQNTQEIASQNYIFKEDENGNLVFVGDFEKYYQEVDEPWGQSGSDKRLKDYYSFSRQKLVESMQELDLESKNILEIGCGQGYVTKLIYEKYGCSIDGMDISETAIKKANTLHKNIDFFVGNICNEQVGLQKTYDVVIFNEVLWYLLEDLEIVFNNLNKMINKDGYLIFSTSFFIKQKHGKNIIDGFNGFIEYMLRNQKNYQLVSSYYDPSYNQLHHYGLTLYKKQHDHDNK